jgi:hypothetical protein
VSSAATAYLVGNCSSSKRGSGAMEREDGGKQAAGRGEDVAPEQSAWTILRQLEEPVASGVAVGR